MRSLRLLRSEYVCHKQNNFRLNYFQFYSTRKIKHFFGLESNCMTYFVSCQQDCLNCLHCSHRAFDYYALNDLEHSKVWFLVPFFYDRITICNGGGFTIA
jgi:hypothetical protein